MKRHEQADELRGEDRRLVDLVTAVLVDPNVHTDLRMRLHREITEVLRTAQRELHGCSSGNGRVATFDASGENVSTLLMAVLVDPTLHTDRRMRLHREIRAVLRCGKPAAKSATTSGWPNG